LRRRNSDERAVLQKAFMSVTCTVHDGKAWWWITKESGKMPVCEDSGECGRDRTELSAGELRCACVVLKIPYAVGVGRWRSVVFIAPMSTESLGAIPRIGTELAGGLWARQAGEDSFPIRLRHRWQYVEAVREGLYSGGLRCTCDRGLLCEVCKAEPSDAWFHEQGLYLGGEPSFVTDAVGTVAINKGRETPWLLCACADDGQEDDENLATIILGLRRIDQECCRVVY
jgi:hypothetical protein